MNFVNTLTIVELKPSPQKEHHEKRLQVMKNAYKPR